MRRAYEIWAHAEALLRHPQSDFSLVDSVANLKRAISHRLKALNSIYDFSTIPVQNKPKRLLEQLAYFEIVRPTMLNTLISVRNALEHEDIPPPTSNRCHELVDVTWYFLRTTDHLITFIKDQILLFPLGNDSLNSDYWLEVVTGPRQAWAIELRGWITSSSVSPTIQSMWLPINVHRVETRRDLRSRLTAQGIEWNENEEEGRGSDDDDMYIHAVVDMSSPIGPEMYRNYFNARMVIG
ncbi:hypothetical protein [Candidatus Chloroploca asiatica]|uniref:hypothetical protein n=1 Tax=Candidatus Chloroploca asiatica TaxID=1506545 RepID=UPI0011436741|nr:hypothetical protein [Candidatus Chloroploca asiatica]